MKPVIDEGNLLAQKTEAIVNPWNRNIIPWWLLLPHGVSGAIKREAGLQPFIELATMGPLDLGNAVATSAGKLPYKYIVHVASIDMLWRASPFSIGRSVESAMKLAEELGIKSLAFPILGAGSGGVSAEIAEQTMCSMFNKLSSEIEVVIVRFSNA